MSGNCCYLNHIPSDLVVDQWASHGESNSYRPFLFRYDVWTMFRRQIREKITSTISTAWYFTTKSGGICWDQLLKPHFHLHALVPGGALADEGQTWNPTSATFLFPVKALSTVFRANYLDGLKQLYAEQALRFTDATLGLEAPKAFNTFVKRLRSKKWIVYAKPPFGGPEQTLSYLGRYTHRVAISNHRLLDIEGDQIRFTFRNRQKGDRLEVAQLEAHTWIQRFLLHVVPSGFMRIRHDGLLANRCKAYTLPLCRRALGQASPEPLPEPQSVAQAMQSWTGIDITRCPACGHQPLERIPLPAALGANRNRDPPAPRP